MRLTSDQFGDAMMEDMATPDTGGKRLDQVAEMVASMEKSITEKIEQANKQVIEHLEQRNEEERTEVLNLETDPEVAKELDELENNNEEDSNNEDNRLSD